MDIDFTTLLGMFAGALTTVSFLPQVLKTWKTRHAKDISLHMFSLLAAGIVLWLIYGIIRMDVPLILANLITLGLVSIMLFFKIRFG